MSKPLLETKEGTMQRSGGGDAGSWIGHSRPRKQQVQRSKVMEVRRLKDIERRQAGEARDGEKDGAGH